MKPAPIAIALFASGLALVMASGDALAGKRFVVPGAHAISMTKMYLNGNEMYSAKGGKRAGSNAYYCPGQENCRFTFFTKTTPRASFETIQDRIWDFKVPRCARIAPGWKVINVEINGTPHRWINKGWREGDPRCLRAVIKVANTNQNQRNYSIRHVILEGPNSATSFREAFDY